MDFIYVKYYDFVFILAIDCYLLSIAIVKFYVYLGSFVCMYVVDAYKPVLLITDFFLQIPTLIWGNLGMSGFLRQPYNIWTDACVRLVYLIIT